MPTFETILYDVEDGIATFTLNRPERLNAFTNQMMTDLIAAFDLTDADDAVMFSPISIANANPPIPTRVFCKTSRRVRKRSDNLAMCSDGL